MLSSLQVALPLSVPGTTSMAFSPVPVAVLPLRVPRKSASICTAVPAVGDRVVEKVLAVMVGLTAPRAFIPIGLRANELALTVGAPLKIESPLNPESVIVLLMTLTEELPEATAIMPSPKKLRNPPKRTMALLIEPLAPEPKKMVDQSPGAGVAALEVKVMGSEDVPLAISVPLTNREQVLPKGANFTTTPGWMVRVTPEATLTPPQDTMKGLPDKSHVVSLDMVPEGTMVCEKRE